MAEEKKEEIPVEAKKPEITEAKEDTKPTDAPKEAKKPVQAKQAQKKPVQAKPVQVKIKEIDFVIIIKNNSTLVAGIIGIVIIALALNIALTPQEANPEDFWNGNGTTPEEKGQLKMIIITSTDCPNCEEGNFFEKFLSENGIRYAARIYEDDTLDAQGIIQATGIKKLPAFVIEEDSIDDTMFVQTDNSGIVPLKDVLFFYVDEGRGSYAEGIFTFPELNLDGKIRSMIHLGEQCGSKDELTIQWFVDPYDPDTIARSKDIENLMFLFDGVDNVTFNYEYIFLPTYSLEMEREYLSAFGGKPETVRGNIQQLAKNLVCANEVSTEKFVEVQQGIYSKYCGISKEDILSGNTRPLFECSDSNHFNNFMTGEELKEILENAGIYNNLKYTECMADVEDRFSSMFETALAADILRTPTVLVNCKYEVPVENVLAGVCLTNPEIYPCFEST